jgi:hypothetical protein
MLVLQLKVVHLTQIDSQSFDHLHDCAVGAVPMVSAKALWWAPVFVAFHDCIASLHWLKSWSNSEEVVDAGEVAVVERLSPRLYKFRRGAVVLLRCKIEFSGFASFLLAPGSWPSNLASLNDAAGLLRSRASSF